MPTLDWIGKQAVVNHHREVPTRLLHCDGDLSFGDRDAGNLLVEGDNLEALKALLPFYAGKVKCIYIDPPYNTGNEGWVYNDNVNSPEIRAWLGKVTGREAEDLSRHDKWLCMMYPRLRLLRDFLSNDGAIWISIDDSEAHSLKLMCDEIFGRPNFVQSIVWQRKSSPANDAKWFSYDHDYVVVYARDKLSWHINRLIRDEKSNAYYTNPDDDPRGPWNSATYTCNKTAEERPNLFYPIINPNTLEEIWPSRTAVWRSNKTTTEKAEKDGLLYWGQDGRSRMPRLKKFLEDAKPIVPRSVWLYGEVGHTQSAMLEQKAFNADAPFPTPKPEALLRKIIEISTNLGDVVLDSFAGSGTTGAVAHKLGRRHISVEMGDHARTHVARRYRGVIDGKDRGGVSDAVNWQGGGGFRYCTLGEPLFDEWGAINEGVTFADLAAFAYFSDTGSPIAARATEGNPLIGTFDDRAIYLLFAPDHAGVASAAAGNVLTIERLEALPLPAPDWSGPRVVYGEGCTVSAERLAAAGVTFKQVPYQLAGA